MVKLKYRIKQGSKGQPLGKYIAEYKASQGDEGNKIYSSKAKFTVHINDGRE